MPVSLRFLILIIIQTLMCVSCGGANDKRLTEEEKESQEKVEAAQGETLSCDLAAVENAVADHITYETGAGCPDACDACIYSDDSERNTCSATCETDSDCEIGQKCVGCFTIFVCATVCEAQSECRFDETCESGLCLKNN